MREASSVFFYSERGILACEGSQLGRERKKKRKERQGGERRMHPHLPNQFNLRLRTKISVNSCLDFEKMLNNILQFICNGLRTKINKLVVNTNSKFHQEWYWIGKKTKVQSRTVNCIQSH